jgi:ribosomal protein S18 acetylase RimI-like enzyme
LETRQPGEQIADAYTRWMLRSAEGGGLVLVAEDGDEFVGFAAGWIEDEENVAETSDSDRFGFISDICILSKYRGKRIANQLLEAIIAHFHSAGIRRFRVGVLAANRSGRLAYERAVFQPYEMIYKKTIAW